MSNNRLKLYDDLIRLSISKKDKAKFRKIAFRNKMTMSEYCRLLIKFVISLDELDKSELGDIKTNQEINTILTILGRDN